MIDAGHGGPSVLHYKWSPDGNRGGPPDCIPIPRVLVMTSPPVEPPACAGPLAGATGLGRLWLRMGPIVPSFLLTDSLLFQNKGETTVKDRRKEQIPDVSFPELQKAVHLVRTHHDLTEADRGNGGCCLWREPFT